MTSLRSLRCSEQTVHKHLGKAGPLPLLARRVLPCLRAVEHRVSRPSPRARLRAQVNHKLDFEDVTGLRCFLDVGRRPLALAARCGHLVADELLAAPGASADLDGVDAAVLAVAHGESVRLPNAPAPAPALGNPSGNDYGWILRPPLDCALSGLKNNRAVYGDYPGIVEALLRAGAPTSQSAPIGDEEVNALLDNQPPVD